MKDEDDPLDPDPPAAMRESLRAIEHLERAVRDAPLEGLALRYGLPHGPGTSEPIFVERAEAELARAGARPRRRALTGTASLTASERRVAGMAAAGQANKEIAQALFVTLRTVEMHLSRTYAKLGIASRRKLPQALAGDAE